MELGLQDTRVPLRLALRLLAATFAITGGAGLLAEQCFEKLLARLLGASTPAAAVVLAVYFLGLTLGAASYPRIQRRWKSPLRVYAVLEAGVALWSVLLLVGADPSVRAMAPILRLGAERFWLLETLRFGEACFWILPPTLLMGATFPAVVDALERSRVPQPRRAMARYYSWNLVGALTASIVAPYLLLPSWGLTGCLALTSVVDATACALVFLLDLSLRPRARPKPSALPVVGLGRTSGLVLGLALGSGFVIFSLEVLWTHLVAVTLGCSVYAFATMLSCVLLGLAIGGSLSTLLFPERRPISAWVVGTLLVLGSGLVLWQHLQWPDVSDVLIQWGGSLVAFHQAETLRAIVAAWLLLPASTILGMVYPALFRVRELGAGDRAATVARMAALNSAGCVLGALSTGFGLIPLLGSEATSRLLGALLALGGLVMVATLLSGRGRLVMLAAAGMLLWQWARVPAWDRLRLTWGGNVYFRQYQVTPQSELVLFHEDTLGGITTVVRNRQDHSLTLLTNGKFQAEDTVEVKAQESFALIPTLFVSSLRSALVIGLGSGYSAHVIHEMGFNEMDVAELAPGIVMAARGPFSKLNQNVLDQPNVALHLEDGRNYLLLTHQQYDLISMEITSVWFAGATSVYSREFYETAKDHLRPAGVLQQWVQLHHLTMSEVGSTLATVREAFRYVELWVRGGQGIILASNQPLRLHQAGLAAYDAHPLSELPSNASLRKLLASELLAPEDIDQLIAETDFTVNTDWNRYLEYATPRYSVDRRPLDRLNIQYLSKFRSGMAPVIDEDVEPRFREALQPAPSKAEP